MSPSYTMIGAKKETRKVLAEDIKGGYMRPQGGRTFLGRALRWWE